MDNDLKKTLQAFVTEWKEELATSGHSRGLLGKREGREIEEEEEEEEEKRPAEMPSGKKPSRREPSPLLVLPPGQVEGTANEPLQEEEIRGRSPSLLDTLIADLVRLRTLATQ